MDIIQNDTTNLESLSCCRACLSTGDRLLNIHEYKLTDAFLCILGTPVLNDKLPQYLCTFCCALLRKCASFKNMCLRTQQHLVTELLKGELDINILRINHPAHRFLNLNVTPIEIVDCTFLAEDIKIEPNTDIINDSIITNKDFKVELDNKKDVEINDDLDKITLVNAKEKTRKRKVSTKVRKKKGIEIDFDDGIDDISEDNDKPPASKKKEKAKKTVVVKKEVVLKSDADITKPVERTRRKKAKSSSADFSAIESAYSVQIVHLSKEEQLEEIAIRKKTRNYLDSRFRCEDCGKGYDSETAYTYHLLRHSPEAGGLVCEICAIRFKVKCRLQKHQEWHQLKFLCQFGGCSFVSRDRAHAKNHHDMHAGKTYECQHCGKVFNKSTTYLTHVRLTHPAMNVACDICGETFVSQKGCRLHKNRMHPENMTSQKHKCTTCSAEFINVEALNRHLETAGEHSDLRPCEQCGENCASEHALHEHGKEHSSETHRCEECNITFTSSESYDTHHRRKHLNQQYRRQNRHIVRKKYVEGQRKSAQFVCEQCGMIKPNAAKLRYHQRIHDGVKPYACEHCPKAFTLKSALVWHTRTHTGEKPYQCADCPRAFASKANFNRHHRTVHLGIRGHFPCSICGRVFTTRSDARVHVNAVHRGLPWPKRDRRRKKETH